MTPEEMEALARVIDKLVKLGDALAIKTRAFELVLQNQAPELFQAYLRALSQLQEQVTAQDAARLLEEIQSKLIH